jgi:hypothetical protein
MDKFYHSYRRDDSQTEAGLCDREIACGPRTGTDVAVDEIITAGAAAHGGDRVRCWASVESAGPREADR